MAHSALRKLTIALSLLTVIYSTHASAAKETLPQKVADAHGIKGFHKVKRISYTFHVQLGKKNVHRMWRWEPKQGKVSFRKSAKDPWFTYKRSKQQLQTKRTQQVDRWFINDQYWLLFPLHLVWDKGITLTAKAVTKPIRWGKQTIKASHEIAVQYPRQGGYTPGDLYKLYTAKDHTVVAWSFHKGGQAKPSRRTTWENTRAFGPLKISLLRTGAKGSFRIWFTGVSVQTVP